MKLLLKKKKSCRACNEAFVRDCFGAETLLSLIQIASSVSDDINGFVGFPSKKENAKYIQT